jgi:hypothetical protein
MNYRAASREESDPKEIQLKELGDLELGARFLFQIKSKGALSWLTC